MKILKFVLATIVGALLVFSCGNGDEVDKQKPGIGLMIPSGFPQNCDTLYFGEPFTFNALFSDNASLGSYSIDIHHNFDHHSHSTEVSICQPDPDKAPINPLVMIEDFDIPQGFTTFEPKQVIIIPSGNDKGLYDEGDYHFFISLTDMEGWSAQKGLSIKLLHRSRK